MAALVLDAGVALVVLNGALEETLQRDGGRRSKMDEDQRERSSERRTEEGRETESGTERQTERGGGRDAGEGDADRREWRQ